MLHSWLPLFRWTWGTTPSPFLGPVGGWGSAAPCAGGGGRRRSTLKNVTYQICQLQRQGTYKYMHIIYINKYTNIYIYICMIIYIYCIHKYVIYIYIHLCVYFIFMQLHLFQHPTVHVGRCFLEVFHLRDRQIWHHGWAAKKQLMTMGAWKLWYFSCL